MPREGVNNSVQVEVKEGSGAGGAVVIEAHDISAAACVHDKNACVEQDSQLVELWLQEYKGAHGWGE